MNEEKDKVPGGWHESETELLKKHEKRIRLLEAGETELTRIVNTQEAAQEELRQTLHIQLSTIRLLQDTVYRDERKNKQDYICQNCLYKKYMRDVKDSD